MSVLSWAIYSFTYLCFFGFLFFWFKGVGMNSPTLAPGPVPPPASKVQTNTDWKPPMDRFFLKLMLDQLGKGSKTNNSFKKQAWKDMVTLFNAKFGSQYRKSFLKQLYKKLLKYYTDVRSILAIKGFYWDEKEQMIVADDDVWDNYIKVDFYLYLIAFSCVHFYTSVVDVGTSRCTSI